MQNRIVEINTEGAHLSVARGFLVVTLDKEKAGQVALDDISALIVRGHGATFSVNLCARLAAVNVPVVICGSNQAPASVIWPIGGHFAQGLHMQAQAATKLPLLKRLWTHLVRGKIEAQACVLSLVLAESDDLFSMVRRVKSGDIENVEAQAARRYWPRLMGADFKRDRTIEGVNAALNYGYTILRAAMARSILAAGLHPSLSIHHQSRGDALRLADDLMEPFRPWVDFRVRKLIDDQGESILRLTPTVKAELVAVLQLDFAGPQGASPMQLCMDRLAQSLVKIFLNERRDLEMPGQPLPITMSE